MPLHRFGPSPIDLGFNESGPKPPIGNGIKGKIDDHLSSNYGVIMLYHLAAREWTKRKRPKNYFGPNDAPVESYLSDITKILFNKITFYSGPDYDSGPENDHER
jgi:hypothetical protein